MPHSDYDRSYTEVRDAKGNLQDVIFMPSTLETIDMALYDYLNEELDIHAKTNKGFKSLRSYGSRQNVLFK